MAARTKVERIQGFVSLLGVSYFDHGLMGTNAGASVLPLGRHLGSAKTTQAIRITTRGKFPTGSSRSWAGRRPVLIGRRTFLQSHPADAFL